MPSSQSYAGIAKAVRGLLVIGVIGVGVACASPPKTNSSLASSTASQLERATTETPRLDLLRRDRANGSVQAATSDVVTMYMADDAVMIAPRRGYVRSRDSVRVYLASDTLFKGTSITWKPIAAEVSADGMHGYTFGYSEITQRSAPPTLGKYLAYWRRDQRGEWRIAAFKLLRRPPGPVSPQVIEETVNADGVTRTVGRADTAAMLRDLMQIDREFSAKAQTGVADAFRAYTAPNGMTTGARPEFAIGREQVAAEFSAFAPGTLSWKPVFGEIAPSGDLAFVTGDVEIREKKPDGTIDVQPAGKYLTIWRRQADGSWKVVADA